MQYQIVIATISIAIFAIAQCSSSPLPLSSANIPPLCEPGIIEEMPTHIKKVCLALENSNQLSTALNQYIRNEAAGVYFVEAAKAYAAESNYYYPFMCKAREFWNLPSKKIIK